MTAKKEDIAENNQTRFRRAQAWLNQAKIWQRECKSACEAEAKDRLLCAEFVSLWIAFNALYGRNRYTLQKKGKKVTNLSETECIRIFFLEIENKCEAQEKLLQDALEKLEAKEIEPLITLDKAYDKFWSDRKSPPPAFNDNNDKIRNSIRRNPINALRLIFERIYVVRNQVFHGAHTIGGSWGKEQIDLSTAILRTVVPIIKQMMRNPKAIGKRVAFHELMINCLILGTRKNRDQIEHGRLLQSRRGAGCPSARGKITHRLACVYRFRQREMRSISPAAGEH